MSRVRRIYLSPHFDDVALSCGATMAAQARAGAEVIALTVCAGDPGAGPVSRFARMLHQVMGASDGHALWRTRRDEDRESARILGARCVWLDWLDAIYRGAPRPDARPDARSEAADAWYYPHPAALFAPAHPAEHGLGARIADQIRAQVLADRDQVTDTCVFVPAGVGGHVDHRLVHEAGWALHEAGVDVEFYEDFPYIEGNDDAPGIVERAAASRGVGVEPHLVAIAPEDVDARIRAVAAYESQAMHLFGDASTIPDRVRAATRRYADQPCERFWVPRARAPG